MRRPRRRTHFRAGTSSWSDERPSTSGDGEPPRRRASARQPRGHGSMSAGDQRCGRPSRHCGGRVAHAARRRPATARSRLETDESPARDRSLKGPNREETRMLATAKVATRLPAQDLDRARAFYAETLGLEPSEERPGGLLYTPAGGGEFALFTSAGAPSGTHTQMGFEVDDIEALAAHLRERGVTLEVTTSRRSRATTPARAGAGSVRSGSATARATSWARARRCRRRPPQSPAVLSGRRVDNEVAQY